MTVAELDHLMTHAKEKWMRELPSEEGLRIWFAMLNVQRLMSVDPRVRPGGQYVMIQIAMTMPTI